MSNKENTIKCGYLIKRGGIVKSWKKRWFVIKGNIMYYFKKEKSSYPRGMLPLTNSVIVDYAKKGRKKFVFSVNIPSARIYFISAKSEEDRDDWMKAISDTIKTQKTDKLSLKDFRVISIIGKGSDGKVTLVKELNSGQLYAMKIIKKSSVADNEQISQTMSERNVLMRVKHPFLIGLRYSFQTEEKLYMVLDYAPGGELFYHLKNPSVFQKR